MVKSGSPGCKQGTYQFTLGCPDWAVSVGLLTFLQVQPPQLTQHLVLKRHAAVRSFPPSGCSHE